MLLLTVQLPGGRNKYGLVWAVMIKPPDLSINDEARMMLINDAQAQVCGSINANPGLLPVQ